MNIFNRSWILALVSLSLLGTSHAAGNPAAGKQKAAACFGCHGEDGNSPAPSFPKLAGQKAAYIIEEIVEFQKGTRKDDMMAGMAAMLADPKDLKDVAAYFESQKRMIGTGETGPLIQKGEQLFYLQRCGFCHVERSKGDPIGSEAFISTAPFSAEQNSVIPLIGGQHKDYLVKAMKDIKEGKREGDRFTLMGEPGLMARLFKKFSEEEIEAVAQFLASWQPMPEKKGNKSTRNKKN